MKNLVIGASGLIGGAILHCSKERGYETSGTRLLDKGSKIQLLNIADRTSVFRLVRNLEPEVIFFCAGTNDVDQCETDPDKSYEVNVLGLKNLLDAAIRVDAKLVFVSSAFIFDGTAGPYSELDTPNPRTVYGWHKLLGEHLIATSDCPSLIIRTSNVFGWDRLNKNSVLQVTHLLKHERKVTLPEDIVETPIYSRCLANAILDLVEAGREGVYNVSGNESISRFKFGKNIAEVFGLEVSLIKPTKAKELQFRATRPANSCLTNKKAKKIVATSLPGTQVGLKQMLKDEL